MLPFSWTMQTLPVSGRNASLIRSQGHSLGRTDSLQCWLLPLWPFLLGKHIQDAILTSRRPSEASPIWALRQVPTRVPIQIGLRGYRRLWWANREMMWGGKRKGWREEGYLGNPRWREDHNWPLSTTLNTPSNTMRQGLLEISQTCPG